MPVWRLDNPVQHYDWGSPDYIPELLGSSEPDARPVAELWLGAHPKAPSLLGIADQQIALDKFIASNPEAILGKATQLYDGRLPFLFKVLAAESPLSIQAHPSKAQARLGFARENALRVPPDAPQRNYRDDNHKPELICALTQFTMLCGFRAYADICRDFRSLGLDSFFSTFGAFAKFGDQRSFQLLMIQILTLPKERAGEVLRRLSQALAEDAGLPMLTRETVLLLLDVYPGDIGALAPLYLNLRLLQPGEAVFLGPGIPHAYLHGAGLELMANSDNVLRGGLTPKHMDIEELARILDFSPYYPASLPCSQESAELRTYESPAEEFSLSAISLEGGSLALDTRQMPVILLCLEGAATLRAEAVELELTRGGSAFVSADTGPYSLSGSARLWAATVPPLKTETPLRK